VDRHHFYADPDPNFHFDADPDQTELDPHEDPTLSYIHAGK
jgi:hypothetical protein